MARDIRRISLFEGAHELLRELSSCGAILALVTSNSRRNVRTLLGPESSALIRHLECGTRMFGKGARLRRVLRRSGVPAREAIYIGDELRDREAARDAGIAFGAVSWGYGEAETLKASSPDEVFDSLGEIAAKLTAR
jgi:phosphoglycolate phosphatase